MVGIPKNFLSEGLKPSEYAVAAVKSIEEAAKKMSSKYLLIPENIKFERQPSSDLFEKVFSEMTSKDFWHLENEGQYIRGQHLADIAEGKYVDIPPEGINGTNDSFSFGKVSYNADGKPVRVWNKNKVFQLDSETGNIVFHISLDKNSKLDSVIQYDSKGSQIKQLIPAKGNKPMVYNYELPGGFVSREYFADGSYTHTQGNKKFFFTELGELTKFYEYNRKFLLFPFKRTELKSVVTCDDFGKPVKRIDIEPGTGKILGVSQGGIYTPAE